MFLEDKKEETFEIDKSTRKKKMYASAFQMHENKMSFNFIY